MKVLLRSCIIVEASDDRKLFLRNFSDFQDSGLELLTPEEQTLYTLIKEFVRTHNHVPEIATLRDVFRRKGEDECLNLVEEIAPLHPLVQGDFAHRLGERVEDRRLRDWSETLRQAGYITQKGLEVGTGKDKKLPQGPQDAAKYVLEHCHAVLAPTLSTKLSGEVTRDGEDFMYEYERVEADPLAGIGQHTGLEQIDVCTNGAKRAELWLHAAFTGHGKSLFALNWAYNQAVYFNHNSLYFSLEMPYAQCRRILFAMHSCHHKFRSIRHSLGLQTQGSSDVGLSYVQIRDGLLNPAEKKFLKEYVVPDLKNPANKYGRIDIEMADPEKTDFTITDLRTKAEVLYGREPFAMLIIDHVGLMSARNRHKDTTENLNEVIRDLKKMAMGFNRGRGMAVVGLCQISREGHKAATKRQERTGVPGYDLTHLSYANELERSGDVITATWLDPDLSSRNRIQFQCMKSRDQAPFTPFYARVEWPCRRLFVTHEVPTATVPEAGGGGDRRAAAAKAAADLDKDK